MSRDKTTRDVLEASVAMRSKISLTKLLRIAIALLEIPVSGWTCLRTSNKERKANTSQFMLIGKSMHRLLTLVDVGGVGFLSDLLSLLLLAISRRCGLGGFLGCLCSLTGFGRGFGGGRGRGLASSRSGFGSHWRW